MYVERTRFNNQEGAQEHGGDAFLDVIKDDVKEVNREPERKAKLLSRLKDSVNDFESLKRNVFVVYPVPEVAYSPAKRFARELVVTKKPAQLPTHSYPVYLVRNEKVRTAFEEIERDLKSINNFLYSSFSSFL